MLRNGISSKRSEEHTSELQSQPRISYALNSNSPILFTLSCEVDGISVEGKINPADLASRGFMPSENDKLTTWLSGPPFLQTCEYPTSTPPDHPLQFEELESKESVMIAAETHHFLDSIVERCGSWNKVKETTRLVLRFVKLIAKRSDETTNEESIILKRIHEITFQDDYSRLQNDKQISAASKLAQLNPFLDPEGVIRDP